MITISGPTVQGLVVVREGRAVVTSYGFRLFQLSLRRERKRTDLPFVKSSDDKTWRYSDHLCKLLTANTDARERGLPRADPDEELLDEQRKSLAIFTVEEHSTLGSGVVFTMSYGVQTGHDAALADPDNPDDEDIDISAHYPSRTYRGVIVFPDGESTEALLALECISQACPRTPLVKWLTQWSKAASVSKAGEPQPWWTLRAFPFVDEETLRRFMEKASAETIYLKRHKVTEDRKREVDEFDLRVEIARKTVKQGALSTARDWVTRKRAGNEVSQHAAARTVAALVGGDQLAEMDFDEARIQVHDPTTGKDKMVTPSKLPEVFTYPVSADEQPKLSVLHASIRGVVARVHPSLYALVDWSGWPTPKE
jgi:hypothetical protein